MMASCVTSVVNIQFAIGQGVMPAFLLLLNGLEFYHAGLGESIELQAFSRESNSFPVINGDGLEVP